MRPLVADGRVLGRPGGVELRFRWLKAPLQILLGQITARAADRVLAPSAATAAEIRRDYRVDEVGVIPNVTGGLDGRARRRGRRASPAISSSSAGCASARASRCCWRRSASCAAASPRPLCGSPATASTAAGWSARRRSWDWGRPSPSSAAATPGEVRTLLRGRGGPGGALDLRGHAAGGAGGHGGGRAGGGEPGERHPGGGGGRQRRRHGLARAAGRPGGPGGRAGGGPGGSRGGAAAGRGRPAAGRRALPARPWRRRAGARRWRWTEILEDCFDDGTCPADRRPDGDPRRHRVGRDGLSAQLAGRCRHAAPRARGAGLEPAARCSPTAGSCST